MKFMTTALLALTTLLPLSAQEYETVKIYALEIPGLHQADGEGVYDKIINSIDGLNCEIEVVPPKRAFALFENGTNICISPANTNPEFYDFSSDVQETKEMGVAEIFIFSPKGNPVVTSLDALKGKTIGIRSGMPYGATFDAMGLTVEAVETIEMNISKLDAGRIDYFVAYAPDVYDVFESLNIEPYPHSKENPIAVHPDRLVCRGVSADFIEKFNAAVSK